MENYIDHYRRHSVVHLNALMIDSVVDNTDDWVLKVVLVVVDDHMEVKVEAVVRVKDRQSAGLMAMVVDDVDVNEGVGVVV